jgi:hypothetical protein
LVEAWCRAGVTTAQSDKCLGPTGRENTAVHAALCRGQTAGTRPSTRSLRFIFLEALATTSSFPLDQFTPLSSPLLAPQIAFHLPEACLASLRATERYSLLLRHIPRLLGLSPATEDLLSELLKVYVTLPFFTLASLSLVALLEHLVRLDYTTR